MKTKTNRPTRWMAAFVVLSWLGEYIHNRIELPQLLLWSPENSIPALISALLFLAWWQMSSKSAPTIALLGWTIVQLAGAILTVIPFSFLPFYPPQTAQHYLVHVMYALAQVPLMVALVRQLRLINSNKRLSEAIAQNERSPFDEQGSLISK